MSAPDPGGRVGPPADRPVTRAPAGPRRPISRRLMVALFVLMLAPMTGWFFATEPPSDMISDKLDPAGRIALYAWLDGVRNRLAVTFVFAVGVMGAVVFYVRRSMVDPLGALAARARRVGTAPWEAPPELHRADEIGDLSRALHDSVGTLEAQAEEAVHFAVGLSHELRTPLAAIKGAAEVLSDPDLEPADRARFVQNIEAESARLERLVAGLLDLERVRQGRRPPAGGRCDLADTVRRALDRAGPLWARKALQVDLDTQDGLPEVATDGDRATRVLLGLLENAIKFSPKGGRVGVEVSAEAEGVRLVVEDDGPGVPAALRPHVFDRSFIGDRAAGARSTGLGLAIVQGLVQSAKGTVRVENSPQGGARFIAVWPAID